MRSLTDAQVWGRQRFDDPHYLIRRDEVEQTLRARFIAQGGRPVLQHPHYAFFGRHPAWESQKRDGMIAHQIAITDLQADVISITLGDSLLTCHPAYLAEIRALGRWCGPWPGRLYALEDLPALTDRVGAEHLPPGVALTEVLEVQLWVDPDPEHVITRPVTVSASRRRA